MPSMFIDPKTEFLEEVLTHMNEQNLSSISIGENWLEKLEEYGFDSIATFNGFLSDQWINWRYIAPLSLLSFSRSDEDDYRTRLEIGTHDPMVQPKRMEVQGDGRNQSISY